MIEFGVLGPLEVRQDGQALRLGGQKQRLLLAALLLEANRVVASARLIDLLWGTEPPETATNVLQQYISQLRRLVEPRGGGQTLVTQAPGYLLRVHPDQIDAARFESRIAAARKAFTAGDVDVAARLYEEAEALWRGRVLVDLGDELVALRERRRLDELRLGALEDRFDVCLCRGRHAELIAEIEVAAAEHPMRERLQGLLMLALYRCGRQADASAVYHRTRERLVEETGMEPGPALQRLLREIVRQESTLQAPTTLPLQASAEAVDRRTLCRVLIGRDAELACLEKALIAARGEGRMVVLSADAGLGKTRLATELRRRAQTMGYAVLWGGCSEAELSLPYLPFLEAIGNHLARVDCVDLRRHLGPAADAVASLFPQLGGTRVLADGGVDAKHQLYEGVIALLGGIGQGSPLLLVIEDVHWADGSTRELLDYMTRRLRMLRLIVLVTCRSEELHRRHPLHPTIRAWLRSDLAERVELKPLAADQIGEMTCAILARPSISRELRDYLDERTEGSPFVLEELLKAAADSGGVPLSDLAWNVDSIAALQMPRTVVDSVLARVERLSRDHVLVVQAAAVLGRMFAYRTLAAVTRLAESTVRDALEACVRDQLIETVPGRAGRFRFRHALTREAVYEDLIDPVRMELHAQAAAVLYANGETPAVEVIHHLLAAGDVARAVPLCVTTADDMMREYAPSEAAQLYEIVLSHVEGHQMADVLCRLGEALVFAEEHPRAEGYLERGVAMLDAAGRAAEAAHYRLALGRCYGRREQLTAQRAQTERALVYLEPLGPSEDLAQALSAIASLIEYDSTREALTTARRALRVAEDCGSERARLTALKQMGSAHALLFNVDEALRSFQAMLEGARANGDHDLELLAYINLAWVCSEYPRVGELSRRLEALREFPLGASSRDIYLHSLESHCELRRARPHRVLQITDRQLTTSRRAGMDGMEAEAKMIMACALTDMDRLDGAHDALIDVESTGFEFERWFRWASIGLAVAQNDADRAAEIADGVPDATWNNLGFLAEAVVEAFVAAGQIDRAVAAIDRGHAPLRAPGNSPLLARALGRVALERDDGEAARGFFVTAEADLMAAGERREALRTLTPLARACAATGDNAAAVEALTRCADMATDAGAVLYRRLAVEAACELGLSLGIGGAQRHASVVDGR